jgi:hypothetical protein
MKTKFISKTMLSLVLILSLFIISSCTKSANESLTKDQTDQKDEDSETAAIGEKDFTESDDDLYTIDYKEIYDRLSEHGEWIQVRPGEIGLKPNTSQLESESPDDNVFSMNDLFGIKDAKALADVSESMIFVWKPSVDLGISSVSGESPVFTPYTNGQWINTDAGWYFKAPTPVEETVSHYGRWVNSPSAGWLWVPGRVWAPAWVDWKQNENYVSWAPLPPSVYLVNNVISEQIINDKDYVIVDKKYFLEPSVYKYQTLYYKDGNTIPVRDMTGTDGIVVINNAINNIGPDVITMQSVYGRNIEFVKLHHVRQFNEVRFANGECYVYSPDFRKFKNKGNKRVMINVPKSYKVYDEWIVQNSYGNGSKNQGKNEGKDYNGNKNKGNNNDMSKGNNGNMQNGNNGDMNNGNNSNMNNGNNNGGMMHNGNNNGNKNNDKDKGNKNNGQNKGKGKK